MTAENLEHNLVAALLSDLSDIALMTQAGLLLVAFGLAWLGVRQGVRRLSPTVREGWNADEWGRFLMPLIALLTVLAGRPVLANWHSVHLLNLAEPLLMSMFIIQASFFLLRRVLSPGHALHSFERIVSWLVWGAVALHITGYLAGLVQAMDAIGFNAGKQRISLYTAFLGLISIVVTLVVALWIARMIEGRLIQASPLNTNLKVALAKLIRALLLVVAVLIALPIVGIDITVLSVFGGALGVGLGLGLQKIASNYVSGFTLLLDQSIRLGDMVTVDNRFGEVREIATRYTVIRSRDGTEFIIPNETMITSPVVNHTLADSDNRVALPVQVAYDTDLEAARRIMLEAAAQHPRVLKDPQPNVLLVGFGESGINLEMRFWITDPEEGTTRLKSDVNWAIWEGFKRAGVTIPYPHRVVQIQEPKPSA